MQSRKEFINTKADLYFDKLEEMHNLVVSIEENMPYMNGGAAVKKQIENELLTLRLKIEHLAELIGDKEIETIKTCG